MIAVGRSKFLYDSIVYLAGKGYSFDAVITDEAYPEYGIEAGDFIELGRKINSKVFIQKSVDSQEIVDLIKNKKIVTGISVNWKYLIPENFLKLFKTGMLNFHLGNLPDYKGNATVNWSILNGEKHIYGNIHKMTSSLDSGDIIARKKFRIGENTYVGDIYEKALLEVAPLFEKSLRKLAGDRHFYIIKGKESGMRCFPRRPEDSQISWEKDSLFIDKLVRASSRPFHGAYCYYKNKKLIIWKAKAARIENSFCAVPGQVIQIDKAKGSIVVACKKGALKIEEIGYGDAITRPAELIKSIRERLTNTNHEPQ